MDKNELFTFYIFETPLIIYVFFLVLLVGVYLKWVVLKPLKMWQIIFFSIILCIGILLFWSLQTFHPSGKRYSVDKQYSYYLEEYNINKILKRRDPWYYTSRYKAFLFDEVEQKILRSKYLDPWINSEIFSDCQGFSEEENRFYFTGSDYYDLPRPIDKNAIELRERIENSKVYLDWYMISPVERLVYVEVILNDVITEKDIELSWIDRDYYKPYSVTDIDYDTTSLIFIGNIITFKEYFPIKSVDISSLKVIDYSYDFSSRVTVLSPLEKKVYLIDEFDIIKSYDLYEYTHMEKQTGKREECIRSELEKLPYQNMVDWESLQVVRKTISVDKNNIYMEYDAMIKVIPIKDLGLDVTIVENLLY